MNNHPRAPFLGFKPRYMAFILVAACLWLSACSGAAPQPPATPTPEPTSARILPTPTPRRMAPTATRWLPGTRAPTERPPSTPIPTATRWMPETPTPFAPPFSGTRPPDAIPLLEPGQSVVVSEIHMVDAPNGWAIGGASGLDQIHILRTSDGGQSWHDVTPPEPSSSLAKDQPVRAFFMNVGVAWATFSRSDYRRGITSVFVWHTEDGGDSWAQGQPIPPELTGGMAPTSLQFVDLRRGWMVVRDGALRSLITSDGGITWAEISYASSLCAGSYYVFLNPDDGWLLQPCGHQTQDPELHATSNGGAQWRPIPLPPPLDRISARHPSASCKPERPSLFRPRVGTLAFTCQDDAGWIGGLLYRTQDDGQTWEIFPYPGGSLQFLDENLGWALGRDIHKTTDSGRTWTRVKTANWDGQFSFVDAEHGWAVARSGDEISLVKTDDGGRTWQELFPIVGGSLSLRSIEMFDSLHGWAMAGSSDEARRILRTVDGGRTWEDVSPTSPGGISDYWTAIDAHHAWVLVDGEQESTTLCRTHDGGDVWACDSASGAQLSLACYPYLSGIEFVDELNGWLSAFGGPAAGSVPLGLFHTQDGGQTWREASGDAYEPYLMISNAPFATSFISPRSGWLLTGSFASAYFTLRRTDNAGRTWVEVDLPPTPSKWGDLNHYCTYGDGLDLLFSSPSAGIFAVGFDKCKIEEHLVYKVLLYTTDDGGRSWNAHSVPEPDLPDLSTGFLRRETAPYLATADIAWIGVRDLHVVGGHEEILEEYWYRTADGGRTWTEAEGIGEKQGYTDLSKLDFLDNQTGWALVEADDGSTGLFVTQDGGMIWTELGPQLAH